MRHETSSSSSGSRRPGKIIRLSGGTLYNAQTVFELVHGSYMAERVEGHRLYEVVADMQPGSPDN
jgi:hypothetical protein